MYLGSQPSALGVRAQKVRSFVLCSDNSANSGFACTSHLYFQLIACLCQEEDVGEEKTIVQ